MKKVAALTLALALALALAACGTQGDKPSAASSVPGNGADTNTSNPADSTQADIDWPAKSVNFVIGFSAGGGADITARTVFQPYVEDILGQKFVISYLPGSNGEVSYTECAKTAKKDGYTLYWGAHPGFLTLPLTKDSCQFELEDFQPVARIATDPNIFIVNGTSEFNTLEDIVNYAKENPSKLTVGIGALNADDDLAAEQFLEAAGVEVNKIVYADGTTDRVTACMGGHIQVCVLNASEVSAYLGQVKILGVMAPERLDFLSDVPTFAESGYEIYNSSDRGVIMPAGVDEAIVSKLSNAIGRAMEEPACQEAMANLNLIPAYLDYKAFSEDLYRMRDVYAEIVGGQS